MKRLKKETIIAAVFVLCLVIFFVCLVPTWYLVYEQPGQDDYYHIVPIDWEERYPFENATKEKTANESGSKSLITRYTSIVTWIEERTSAVANNGIIARYPISEFYCNLQKNLGYKRFTGEDRSVLVLQNNVYSFHSEEDNTLNNATIVENISEFQQWLNAQNIEYLYIMEPCKTSPVNKDEIYEGYVDYQKFNMETLTALMEQSNINFLDLQEEATQMGNVNQLFYRTDHHWKSSTALWAAKVVAENLNEKLGYQIDVSRYDPDVFETIDYGARFLGTQGKKVTLSVAKPDDFELLLPNYNTELHVIVENLSIDKTGTFEDTLIDYSHLKDADYPYNYYLFNEYCAYGGGSQPLIAIENNLAANDLRVLFLKDSFVNAMGPFFALGVRDTALLDARHFTGSIRSYIQEYKPDIVITMCNGGSWNPNDGYESHTNILDYR